MEIQFMHGKAGGLHDLVRPGFIYEPNLPGIRALLLKFGKQIKLINSHNREITDRYPEVIRAAKNIQSEKCVLDGKILCFNEKGDPDLQRVLRRDQASSEAAIKKLSAEIPAAFVAADVLRVDNTKVSSLPLWHRKNILDELMEDSEQLQRIYYTSDGLELWNYAISRRLDEVVAKDIRSSYEIGKSAHWIKIKNFRVQDCVVIGYHCSQQFISSLVVGAYYRNKLYTIGRIAAQMSVPGRKEMLEKLQNIHVKRPAFEVPAHFRDVQWVRPRMVCEVKYTGLSADFQLQSPLFLAARYDKNPSQCLLEIPFKAQIETRAQLTALRV